MDVCYERPSMAAEATDFDYVLVGGGLQNGLIALALCARPHPPRLAIVERGACLGGNHTWCFHAGDIPEGAGGWIAPLVASQFSGYDVAFPGFSRHIEAAYSVITQPVFDGVVRARVEAAGGTILTDCEVSYAGAHRVELAGGGVLSAAVVIDSRGPGGAVASAGYQKFVGHELLLSRPHGITAPLLMDATCEQIDGYRFFYVLPLSPDRVLIEDTRFSETPSLDRPAFRAAISAYAASRGLGEGVLVREETGVLPMPYGGSPAPAIPRAPGPIIGGYGGGWFHPATGYSFPAAVRLAAAIGALPEGQIFGPALAALARSIGRQARFSRMLNRLLFHGFAGADRWRVMARFCHLPEPTIRRFYAMAMSPADAARIIVGRPPRGLSMRRLLTANAA